MTSNKCPIVKPEDMRGQKMHEVQRCLTGTSHGYIA
jgi:TRAP-type C4-dicarboxylate transport system substrate-binding protein